MLSLPIKTFNAQQIYVLILCLRQFMATLKTFNSHLTTCMNNIYFRSARNCILYRFRRFIFFCCVMPFVLKGSFHTTIKRCVPNTHTRCYRANSLQSWKAIFNQTKKKQHKHFRFMTPCA